MDCGALTRDAWLRGTGRTLAETVRKFVLNYLTKPRLAPLKNQTIRNYYRCNTPPPAGIGKKSAHLMNYLCEQVNTMLTPREGELR